jgi:hypothetical protein
MTREYVHLECGMPWTDHRYRTGKGKGTTCICPDDPLLDELPDRPTPDPDPEDERWDYDMPDEPPWWKS